MSDAPGPVQERTLGLLGATGVGVGAIVGGGIFVLAGVAFAEAGPAAMVAFAVNGGIAFLTAMSFAEITSAFPESGGAYAFAKRVLSVRAAFAVGWILWFAYIVAGVLYALGFASFAVLALQELWRLAGSTPPEWIMGRRMALLLATLATIGYAVVLMRKSGGGGQWETLGKLVVFAVVIVVGLFVFLRGDTGEHVSVLKPFFAGGASGLLMAMGVTFIALQGFDLISAVAGEVKDPGRNIPRAMFLSLGCAMVVYLPLLFVVSTVGVGDGQNISELARSHPESVIPLAAKQFMGVAGYWLVIVAAILSTLSALYANLLAASRVALSMARDSTLPSVLGDMHKTRRTPVVAIFTTALTLVAITFMIPNLAGAGAAASLIFLISFTLTHVTVFLARQRGGTDSAPYKTPWFPAIPIAGGVMCGALGVFQALSVPDAGGIVAMWGGLGVLLYWTLFARQATAADASMIAQDPSFVSMRGHSPLVLVPIANPAQSPGMIAVANALAAPKVGRVLLLSIVPLHEDTVPAEVPPQLADTQRIIHDSLVQSYASGHRPEALITAALDPLREIQRIADEHKCESLLLGFGDLAGTGAAGLERLLNKVDCDVAFMRASPEWRLGAAKRVLVPIAGRGEQHDLRARLLGSLTRTGDREVTFVAVLPANATDARVDATRRDIGRLADLKVKGARVEVLCADDAPAALLELAGSYDLMIMGLKSVGLGKKVFGQFTLRVVRDAPCATILLSRRRNRAFELLDPLRDDVVRTIKGVARKARPGRS